MRTAIEEAHQRAASSGASGRFPIGASSGNHGVALPQAVRRLGLEGKLLLLRTAPRANLRAIESYDAGYELGGDDIIEDAAARSVAAALSRRKHFGGRRVALIVTGSRIDDEALRRILA